MKKVVQQTNPEKKKSRKGCLIPVIIVIMVFGIFLALIISSPSEPTNNDTTTTTTTNTQEEKIIFEDDVIKASFIKVYDESSIEGAVYLQMLIENTSDKEIMVTLTDASVNNMSTTIGSGVPMVIAPGNSSKQPFIIFTNNTDVTKAEDISNLQFKFYLFDNADTSVIEESKTIEINL